MAQTVDHHNDPAYCLAKAFADAYYAAFRESKFKIGQYYNADATVQFDNYKGEGTQQISDIFQNQLKFEKLNTDISNLDCQEVKGGAVLVHVSGRCLIDDEDKPVPFSQCLLLIQTLGPNGEANWSILNDIFRLALHNA